MPDFYFIFRFPVCWWMFLCVDVCSGSSCGWMSAAEVRVGGCLQPDSLVCDCSDLVGFAWCSVRVIVVGQGAQFIRAPIWGNPPRSLCLRLVWCWRSVMWCWSPLPLLERERRADSIAQLKRLGCIRCHKKNTPNPNYRWRYKRYVLSVGIMPVYTSNSCMLQKMCNCAPYGHTFWWLLSPLKAKVSVKWRWFTFEHLLL